MDNTAIEFPKFCILVSITFVSVIAYSAFIIALAKLISRLVRSPRSTMLPDRGLAGLLVFDDG